MRFHRGTAACTAALVMVSGLAGCGDEEPTSQSSSSGASGSSSSGSGSSSNGSSSSAGTSSDDLPADLPEAAREETKEGAAAFGEYYYKAMGDASHSGKTEALSRLSLKSCPPCEQAITDINADAELKRTRSADPYRFSNVAASKRPDKGYKVSMDVNVKPHKVYQDGKVIGSVDAVDYKLTEHVVWQDGQWKIADWVIS